MDTAGRSAESLGSHDFAGNVRSGWKRFAELVMERRLELGEMLAKESESLIWREAVWEADSVAYVIEGSCEVAKHFYGKPCRRDEPGYDHDIQFTIHEPLGVIACIIPLISRLRSGPLKGGRAGFAGNAVAVKGLHNPMTILEAA